MEHCPPGCAKLPSLTPAPHAPGTCSQKRVELVDAYARVINMIEIEVEMETQVPAAEVLGGSWAGRLGPACCGPGGMCLPRQYCAAVARPCHLEPSCLLCFSVPHVVCTSPRHQAR